MNKLIGQIGEEIAIQFLRKKGYLIKDRNFKRKWGEIDIIAFDRKTKEWVFVEVKTIKQKENNLPPIFPEEELTPFKIQKLRKVILSYLNLNKIEENKWRFDFIGVLINTNNQEPVIRHYQSEFFEI